MELHRGRDFLPAVESQWQRKYCLNFYKNGEDGRCISESGHGKEETRCVELRTKEVSHGIYYDFVLKIRR